MGVRILRCVWCNRIEIFHENRSSDLRRIHNHIRWKHDTGNLTGEFTMDETRHVKSWFVDV